MGYQQEIGLLRQQILSCEGELRTVSSPAYTAKDRDKALAEQSACRERIKGLQSKITAFSQRMNLINQRGTPDSEEIPRAASLCILVNKPTQRHSVHPLLLLHVLVI